MIEPVETLTNLLMEIETAAALLFEEGKTHNVSRCAYHLGEIKASLACIIASIQSEEVQ